MYYSMRFITIAIIAIASSSIFGKSSMATAFLLPVRPCTIFHHHGNDHVSHLNAFLHPELVSTCLSTTVISVNDVNQVVSTSSSSSWRQYVPLIVSFGVILDILLGSPMANLLLAPMRRAAAADTQNPNDTNSNTNNSNSNTSNSNSSAQRLNSIISNNPKPKDSRERIDSDAVAQAAINKARYSLELRKFLDENKTNEDRYNEMRRKIDLQSQDLDNKLDSLFDNDQ